MSSDDNIPNYYLSYLDNPTGRDWERTQTFEGPYLFEKALEARNSRDKNFCIGLCTEAAAMEITGQMIADGECVKLTPPIEKK